MLVRAEKSAKVFRDQKMLMFAFLSLLIQNCIYSTDKLILGVKAPPGLLEVKVKVKVKPPKTCGIVKKS